MILWHCSFLNPVALITLCVDDVYCYFCQDEGEQSFSRFLPRKMN